MSCYPIDKKTLWKQVVYEADAALEAGLFHMLLNRCRLDSLENGIAVVAADSRLLADKVEKKALHALRAAFSEVLERKVQVKIVIGRPRIIEKPPESAAPLQRTSGLCDALDVELSRLHERYGDIMGIVDSHPVFRKAGLPIEQGGWGIFPQLLTNACKEYGVINILNGLRFIANRPNIRNPRGFFFQALKEGQFGHKLAVMASMVG